MNTTEIKIADVRLLVTESEKNIQINDIPEEKFEFVWERVVSQYSGYEVFFCFNSERMAKNQKVPVEFLDKIRAKCIDDMLNFKVRTGDFNAASLDGKVEIALLTEVGFDEFATFHDTRNPDMFWTSKRIKKRLDIWQIHTSKKNGRLDGYVMMMSTAKNTEIFAIESCDDLVFKTLLSTACQNAFTIGKKEVLYMIDTIARASHQQAALEIGFKETGFYQGFQVYL